MLYNDAYTIETGGEKVWYVYYQNHVNTYYVALIQPDLSKFFLR